MTIRTHVVFRTERFDMDEVKPNCINPRCFGEDLATWLAEELGRAEIGSVTEPWQEDWGWQLRVDNDAGAFFVSVGIVEGERRWLVFVEPSRPLLPTLFGRRDEAPLATVVEALHRVLSTAEGIEELRWFTHDEHSKGDASGLQHGAPRP